jgi:pimeloyl-ACP methyl ester carboxylesterase
MTRVIPPVVFLHSLAGSPAHWEPLIERLRDRPDLAAMTAVPVGWTSLLTQTGGDLPAVATAAARMADSEHPVVIVAHSSGATLALAWAAAHPTQVLGLFLVDPAGSLLELPKKEVQAYVAKFEKDYAGALKERWDAMLVTAKPETAAQVKADLDAADPKDVMAVTRGWVDFDPAAAARRYGGPIEMVLAGDGGPLSLAKTLPDVKVTHVLGTSHWVHLDAPDAVADALEAFLVKVGALR